MPHKRILIADDEEDVLDMCVRALSLQGYQVFGAHNGFEATEMAKKEEFDLLLTDIKMPGMTGLQAFHAIKEHNPDIVGVTITGYARVDAAIEALKLGMNDFLLKPFSPEEVTAAVSRALERKTLQQENARLKALIPLFKLSHAFVTVTDLDALLQQVLQVAVQETAAGLGVLMLMNETSGDLEVRAVATDRGSEPLGDTYRLRDEIARKTMQSGQGIVWQNESGLEPFFALERVNTQVNTAVALPLIVQGETIGILSLGKRGEGTAFAHSDVELFSVLASQAAIAIQNAHLFTRIRNAYEKLSALDHLKSEVINIASHELRTPLAIISTYTDLIEQTSQPQQQEYLSTIAGAVDRLTLLMNNITDLKCLEAGEMELQRGELSLSQLLAEVMDQVSPLAASKGQFITTQVDDQPPDIHADGPKIKIVLQNLLTNAIKFTPEGGSITVEAEATGNGVHVAVHDTGIGIPEKEWEWIFKPLHQLENSLVRQHAGIGIGLALAKNLVELHGGRIWVESTVGHGSTFHFTIPDCLCSPGS